MFKTKPFAITALCLLYTACIAAQPVTGTVKNHVKKKRLQFSYVLSFNVGIYSFPKNYSTINISLPYTVTSQQGGNTQSAVYKARISNYFTKAATVVDALNIEILNAKHGVNFTFGFSPNYSAGSNNETGASFLSAGYQWLIPLTKKPGNTFVLKPGVSFGFYQFNVGFDSTIDNKQKTITIVGQTYGPTFSIGTWHRNRASLRQVDADHLQIFYQNTSFMLTPQVTLAHQSKHHRFYYSVTAGWAQRFAGNGGAVVIKQRDDGSNTNGRITVPVTSIDRFSGPSLKAGIGLYFDRGRMSKRRLRREGERYSTLLKDHTNILQRAAAFHITSYLGLKN